MVSIESNIYNKSSAGEVILGATVIILNDDNSVEKITIVDEEKLNELKSELDVLDETYIRFDENSQLSGRSIDSLLSNSNNSVVINATKLNGVSGGNYSQEGHVHDDRYFTESEITNKLSGKSDTGHTHTGWSSVSSGVSGVSLYVNTAIRMVMITFNKQNVSFKNSTNVLGTLNDNYKPKHAIVFQMYHPYVEVLVNSDGTVTARSSNYGSGKSYDAWGAGMYAY